MNPTSLSLVSTDIEHRISFDIINSNLNDIKHSLYIIEKELERLSLLRMEETADGRQPS